MQPPRPRRPRRRSNRSRIWFEVALAVGAALNALLFLRLAILLAAVDVNHGLPWYLHRVLDPAFSLINELPILSARLPGAVRAGDVAVSVIALLLWLLCLGIIVGWYSEDQQRRVGPR